MKFGVLASAGAAVAATPATTSTASESCSTRGTRREFGNADRTPCSVAAPDAVSTCWADVVQVGRWLPPHDAYGCLVDDQGSARVTKLRDGVGWQIGAPDDVAWIARGTTIGVSITSAVPPTFQSYATVVLPADPDSKDEHERRMMRVLTRSTADQPWWLGYLDTGVADVVFPDAPRVLLYANWPYVLVKAGAAQAVQWRAGVAITSKTRLPDLMFPESREWIVSVLWDDDWWCVGAARPLIGSLADDPKLKVRIVSPDEDATPPGHVAR